MRKYKHDATVKIKTVFNPWQSRFKHRTWVLQWAVVNLKTVLRFKNITVQQLINSQLLC